MSNRQSAVENNSSAETVRDLIRTLETAESELDGLPGAELWRAELEDVRQRLLHARRLVAVFGAFSAGKSSLLNALLAAPLLAVSPNPTTAAVTRLTAAPQTEARVTAKNADELWEDVADALSQVHRQASTMKEALEVASSLKLPQLPVQARRAGAFLQAVASGYSDLWDRLGQSWSVSSADLRAYTADERVACYLKEVDIGYPSRLLEDGFDLVDTPGVDSVHRRHTDVAFRYMSRADAIIFVLYYTHAFSRADKDFLLQLAGVQDVLRMDKLFVVINAVDLAVSGEEREAVREHVEAELRKAGIRFPRVFEVSSQVGLAGAQLAINPDQPQYRQLATQRLQLPDGEPLPDAGDLCAWSGIPALANELKKVSEDNRVQLAESTVLRALAQVARQVHASWLTVRQSRETDEAQRTRYAEAVSQLHTRLLTLQSQVVEGSSQIERSLAADWDELSFHAGERIRLRLGELFREAFHPGRFRDGRTKEALMDAADELAATLSRQLDVEARTFALRVRRETEEAIVKWRDMLQTELDEVGGGAIAFARAGEATDEQPVLNVLAEVDARAFVPAFTHFKSARQFFEGEGQQAMRAEVEEIATQSIRTELKRILQTLTDAQREHWRAQASGVVDVAVAELSLHSNRRADLSDEDFLAWQRANDWFESYLLS